VNFSVSGLLIDKKKKLVVPIRSVEFESQRSGQNSLHKKEGFAGDISTQSRVQMPPVHTTYFLKNPSHSGDDGYCVS